VSDVTRNNCVGVILIATFGPTVNFCKSRFISQRHFFTVVIAERIVKNSSVTSFGLDGAALEIVVNDLF